jgi:acetyl-CoA synthetase
MSISKVYPVSEALAASSLLNKDSYQQMYQQSIETPDTFWAAQATQFLDWFRPWTQVQKSNLRSGEAHWFIDAKARYSNCNYLGR